MTWKREMHVIFDTTWHLVAAGETTGRLSGGAYLPVSQAVGGEGGCQIFSFLSFSPLFFSSKDSCKHGELAVFFDW